jgi:hypothetical protein
MGAARVKRGGAETERVPAEAGARANAASAF